MIETPPRVSGITINRNMHDGLETTINSVLAQTYANLEYLIIDGNSRDGSRVLITRFASCIDHWVSEPDDGIYDAMNKGVRAATGDWVIFMNAGDRFYRNESVAEVFSEPHSDTDLICGHAVRCYVPENVQRFMPAESPSALPLRMNCSHLIRAARDCAEPRHGYACAVGSYFGEDETAHGRRHTRSNRLGWRRAGVRPYGTSESQARLCVVERAR